MALRGIPEAFQSRHAIRRLNIGAVGLALGCITGVVLGEVVGGHSDYSKVALAIAFSTFCLGTFWAAFFRPKGVGRRGFRIGWGISAVLAMLNAQFACVLVAGVHGGHLGLRDVIQMLIAAPTVGIVLWLPALLFTFVCFGAPIVRAQVLAEKGLAGAERGECIVGVACVGIAGLGLLLSLAMPSSHWLDAFSPIRIVGYLGMLAGGLAAYAAAIREGRRRAFVRDVEAGSVAGFRVEPSPEGKVLVRVTSHGEGYRVADFREELVELDASGEAKRARYCELP